MNSKAFTSNLLKSEIKIHTETSKENIKFGLSWWRGNTTQYLVEQALHSDVKHIIFIIYLSIFSHLVALTCLHSTEEYSENANEYPKSI